MYLQKSHYVNIGMDYMHIALVIYIDERIY